MRILLVTDAWQPQVNGVVRTLGQLKSHLEVGGHDVTTITPDWFRTVPCPTYPEIRLAIAPGRTIGKTIENLRPCVVHIATEGPLGLAARNYCVRRGIPFTTAFHTRFAEYVNARFGVPVSWSYAALRWFHGPSAGLMVATESVARDLEERGFRNIKRWTRGVDTELFRPRADKSFLDLPRPIMLYVGRVAVEKNIEAFLRLDLPGTKLVVGAGPQLDQLKRRYPAAVFAGVKMGEDLASHFAASDVFVFPSVTDTFGLVLLEALASGVPVAAFPVPGPLDVVGAAPVGRLDDDLAAAIRGALTSEPAACRAHAEQYSWAACARQFLENVRPFEFDAIVARRGSRQPEAEVRVS
jgi:glycosyltransferase involved in cell wall biosynthesis